MLHFVQNDKRLKHDKNPKQSTYLDTFGFAVFA
jgi:hypothetical protein